MPKPVVSNFSGRNSFIPCRIAGAGSMMRQTMARTPLLSSLALLLVATSPLAAKVFDRSTEIGGLTVHYKVALPKDYDPAKTYPAVLAFPPGSPGMDMVLTTIMQNWRIEGDRRGYIVIVPA